MDLHDSWGYCRSLLCDDFSSSLKIQNGWSYEHFLNAWSSSNDVTYADCCISLESWNLFYRPIRYNNIGETSRNHFYLWSKCLRVHSNYRMVCSFHYTLSAYLQEMLSQSRASKWNHRPWSHDENSRKKRNPKLYLLHGKWILPN